MSAFNKTKELKNFIEDDLGINTAEEHVDNSDFIDMGTNSFIENLDEILDKGFERIDNSLEDFVTEIKYMIRLSRLESENDRVHKEFYFQQRSLLGRIGRKFKHNRWVLVTFMGDAKMYNLIPDKDYIVKIYSRNNKICVFVKGEWLKTYTYYSVNAFAKDWRLYRKAFI